MGLPEGWIGAVVNEISKLMSRIGFLIQYLAMSYYSLLECLYIHLNLSES